MDRPGLQGLLVADQSITKGSLLIGIFESLNAAKAIALSRLIEMIPSILKEPIKGNGLPLLLVSVDPGGRRCWCVAGVALVCGEVRRL